MYLKNERNTLQTNRQQQNVWNKNPNPKQKQRQKKTNAKTDSKILQFEQT